MRLRSLRTALPWLAGASTTVLVSGYVVFGLTDDTIREGEESVWVQEFVTEAMEPGAVDGPRQATRFPARFGGPGPAETLVLYDGGGCQAARAEIHGIAAANLATHFGQVEVRSVEEYTPGAMDRFDGVVYIGTSPCNDLPRAFTTDVREGGTPVLWAGHNVEELAGEAHSEEARAFVSEHGWNPLRSRQHDGKNVTTIVYEGQQLDRDPRATSGLVMPFVVRPDRVEVLGEALCGTAEDPEVCTGAAAGATSFPWALRSGHLIYVSEVPFDYLSESSRYLAFADLYYDLLAPDTEPVRHAAVRLEDVGPEADPADLRRVADFLYERGIPFQVAVVPLHVAKVPGADPVRWYGLSLLDRPEVVSALKYMQERGGTLIQHGTTHQYGSLDNPYDGASGADFEFYVARCSGTEEPPLEFEPCRQDSWVRLTGPVLRDAVEDHVARLEVGRQIMIEAGLGEPMVFEVPHYAASANAYRAITEVYGTRYERSQYFAGLVSGQEHPDVPGYTQLFPYRVHDVYGATVLPENIGNVTEVEQNNHPVRPPEFLIENARTNLVVRESTASFFFHPFLDTAYLDEVVTGIEELGYTFVPAEDLP